MRIVTSINCDCSPKRHRFAVFRMEDGEDWWLTQHYDTLADATANASQWAPHSTPVIKRYCPLHKLL